MKLQNWCAFAQNPCLHGQKPILSIHAVLKSLSKWEIQKYILAKSIQCSVKPIETSKLLSTPSDKHTAFAADAFLQTKPQGLPLLGALPAA
jgi:hypothetical protein